MVPYCHADQLLKKQSLIGFSLRFVPVKPIKINSVEKSCCGQYSVVHILVTQGNIYITHDLL